MNQLRFLTPARQMAPHQHGHLRLSARLRPLPLPALAALGALYLVIAAGDLLRWGGTPGQRLCADAGWTLAGLLAFAACLRTTVRVSGNTRLVWALFAVGSGLWTAGQLAWNFFDLLAGFPPSPTLSDVGYLAFGLAFIAGFLCIGTGSRRHRLLLALDIMVVAAASAVLCLAIFQAALSYSPLSLPGRVTTLLYPIVYGTLTCALPLVPLRRAWRAPSRLLMLLGLLGQVVPFILWTPLLLRGAFADGTWLDLIWMAGMLLIAASALAFERFPAVDATQQVLGTVALLPLALSCVAVLTLLWHVVRGDLLPGSADLIGGLVAGMVLLSALRQGLMLYSSRQLVARLQQAHAAAAAATAALQQRSVEIERLNVELEQRVQRRTTQLAASNQELEAFAYSVSHDLRAPLRSIDGFSRAVLEDYGATLDAEGQEYLHMVVASCRQMGQLIDDMLQLSRVTRAELERTRVDLSALARAVIADLQRADPDRTVTTEIEDGLVAVGDERLLRVVLENVLGNAWKFTRYQPSPHIAVGRTHYLGQNAYVVRDNGAGFDMAYAHKLFGAFQRLHRSTEFEGTGVGLASVQRIIRRHGGDIWAEAAVGQGASFYFTLDSAPHGANDGER